MADDLNFSASSPDAGLREADLIARVRGSPLALANLARTLLLVKGRDVLALELCRDALDAAPNDPEVRMVAAEVLSHRVGGWYFTIVKDQARHTLYEAALGRALAGGGRVLDIGTGTGLFAMMAARAGADEVISCETRPAVAAAAAMVVAKNGFADRVRVLEKASQDIQIGVDMAGPADVLIWDNLTNDLMGAGGLESVEDAVRRLLKPGGRVIPAGCRVKAALAEDRDAWRRRMGQVSGFDLTPFNRFAQPRYDLDAASRSLALRSNETTLFDFDFQAGRPFVAAKARREVNGLGGKANGAALWLDFQLDDETCYEVRPGLVSWSFSVVFFPFARPIEATESARFTLAASHDRESVRLWLTEPRP